MRNKKTTLSQICLFICAALCLALIVTQFLPFWSAEVSVKNADGERVTQQETLSVWGFLSFPENDVQEQFAENFASTYGDDYTINGVAGTACLILGLGVLTIIFTFLKSDKAWTFILPLACGISGVYGYLTQSVLQSGSLWILPVILSALIVVVSLIPCIKFFTGIKRWFTEED